MPVLLGSSSANVDAPIERCWAVVEDVSRWPEWTASYKSMDVLERDDHGRAVICEAISDAKTREVRARTRFTYDPPTKVSMNMIEGDLNSMDASWELQALGAGRTKATYAVAIDLGPVGALLVGPLKGLAVRFLASRRIKELTARVLAA